MAMLTGHRRGQRSPGRVRLACVSFVAVALLVAACTDDDAPAAGEAPVAADEQTSDATDTEGQDDSEDDSEDDDSQQETEPDEEPAEQPRPSTTITLEPLDPLQTEVEIRVGEIIIEFDGQVTDEGTVLTLEEPILFEFDSDVLKDSARAALDDITEVLEFYADAPIEVIGHTDDVGSADYNRDLSQRRADAVVGGLTDRGIDAGRISSEGRGLSEPVASNDTEEGRAQNRRVEVLIVGVEPPANNEE